MGKFLKTLLVGLMAGFLFIGVKAQSNLIAPAPSTAADQPVLSGLFVGQSQQYKVLFRGNGEAIIYVNIDFTNSTDNTLSTFTFETPVAVKDMTILQYRKITCQYNYVYDISSQRCVYSLLDYSKPIETYSTPYYYGGSQNVYQKATFVQDGNKYTVTLPTPLTVNKDGFLLLGFTTKGYVKESLGGFDYKFESLIVDSRITDMTVNIDVDAGLLLKNATTASVNYDASGAEKAVAPGASVTNADLDQLVSYMSYSGSISKNFKELSSSESATMTGTYATTWARVYMNEIIYAVVAVIVVFLVIFLSVKLYKKFHKTTVKTDAPVSGSKMWILVDTALGFGSALSILFFTLLILFLSGYVTTSYYSYGYTYGIFMILAAIIILMIYAFLALFAPVYRGKKRGWVSFGLTFFTEILFLIIMAVIFMSVITMPQLYTIYPAAF